jgi:dienelactone hydrolase
LKSQNKLFLGMVAVCFACTGWRTARAAESTTSTSAPSKEVQFNSPALGAPVKGVVLLPDNPSKSADGTIPTIIYLKNLSIPRLGQEADADIIGDLLTQGNLVVVLDYGKNSNAISPLLNADMLELRNEIGGKKKTLLTHYKVDVNHVFILIEGYRLKRDAEFARDKSRVLAMDIQYPSKPIHPVPTLMEITCDNANRMSCFSLLFCHDTLTDGGMAAGFAVAMIDHPVPPPYKGIDDPMPECIYRLKAAVRTLRSMSGDLSMNGKIGAMGFSRGGPMAALLAVTNDRPDLEGDGPHRDVSSSVQAALIHGNRYDYLKMQTDDHMYKRFEKVWGPRDTNADRWAAHGAFFYLKKDDAVPMFLNTSAAESQEYQFGLATFDSELTAAGVEHVYQVDPDKRGHQVSSDPKTLGGIYAFFQKHLAN